MPLNVHMYINTEPLDNIIKKRSVNYVWLAVG